MADFEDLRLADLLQKFHGEVVRISAVRELSGLKTAGRHLQDVYDFFITASKPYEAEQQNLKNLFSAFNYAAVIVNNAIKNNGLSGDDGELLDECLQIMQKVSLNLITSLKK